MTTRYQYNGFTTQITAIGATTLNLSRQYNGLKQLIMTTDAIGGTTRYAYNPAGQAISLQDANANTIYSHYNALGHKTALSDPNLGNQSFTYNSLGELTSQSDANGNTHEYTYDNLGRIKQRQSNQHISGKWYYDRAGDLGLLYHEINSLDVSQSYSKTHYYTASKSGRKAHYRTGHRIIDGLSNQKYTIDRYTDSHYGRASGVHYTHSGFSLRDHYNEQGYPTQTKDSQGKTYQNIQALNARGQITLATLNNGALSQTQSYSAHTGQMLTTHIQGIPGSHKLHHLSYTYDGFNNLNDQTVTLSNGAAYTESYQYDPLHRLTQSDRSHPSGSELITYTYDALGNFTSKSDYANHYTYGDSNKSQHNAGPNAVYQITDRNNQTINYHYDNNGNLISGAGKTLSYNAFNKPTVISQGGATSTFAYGADLKRYKHTRIGGSRAGTTYYIDEIEIEHSDGQIKTRHPIKDIAIETYTQSQNTTSWETHYTHRDRLGSVVTVTKTNTATNTDEIVEHRSYDPFGKPRKGDLEDPSQNTIHQAINEDGHGTDGSDQAVTPRGFTNHEHLDDVELIHMNGRVYDYNLGRFLSVDPLIQGVDSQAINPYSYIQNNPLSGTDPSGYGKKDEGDAASPDDEKATETEETEAVNDGNGKDKSLNDKIKDAGAKIGDVVTYKGKTFVVVSKGSKKKASKDGGKDASKDTSKDETGQDAPLGDALPGTAAATSATEYYSDRIISAGGDYWDDPMAAVGLSLSILWTPDNAVETALTLSGASGIRALSKAMGPSKQWFRYKDSYSHSLGQKTTKSLSWGASPGKGGKYLQKIPSGFMRKVNQWFRGLKLPGKSWRTQDPGHLHIKK